MTEAMDALIAALRQEGSADRVARAIGVATWTVESWRKGKYRPGRRALALILAAYPHLASLVRAAQDATDVPQSISVSPKG